MTCREGWRELGGSLLFLPAEKTPGEADCPAYSRGLLKFRAQTRSQASAADVAAAAADVATRSRRQRRGAPRRIGRCADAAARRRLRSRAPPFQLPPLPLPPLPLDSPWIISINERLDQARLYDDTSSLASRCIYRVPKYLRDVDKTAYTPMIVSIGPYHLGGRHLRDMDRHKWRALQHALARSKHDVRPYLAAARSLENHARACYEAPLSISSDAFVECLVLDAIFTLELFRVASSEELGYSPKDSVFGNLNTMFSVRRDMIMLENQLPLVVLDRILALQLGDEYSGSKQLANLVLNFFELLWPTVDPLPSNAVSSEGLHCLDVFHRSFSYSISEENSFGCMTRMGRMASYIARMASYIARIRRMASYPARIARMASYLARIAREMIAPNISDKRRTIYCVTKLRDAGIKFRSRKSIRIWNIEFEDGVLCIPRLIIDDNTKSLFLNFMAFEQCHLECAKHITSYVSFMDNLIDSELDVGYLRKMEIIEHGLGNDGEVADMFNRLGREVWINSSDCCLSKASKELNRYCSNICNTWGASFRHIYFSSPWAFSSLIAAVVLLLLTAAQTFYAVYGYYKPN